MSNLGAISHTTMNNIEYKRFAVNMYDIFSNFLPGFILIGGLLIPFLDSSRLSNIGLLKGSFLTLAAFAAGGFTQAIGSRAKYYNFRLPFFSFPPEPADDGRQWFLIEDRKMPFDAKMEDIMQNNGELSFAERKFFDVCEEMFGISGDKGIRDWRYLFKMIISYLEASPHNRTLRIQAQHLAARGLYVTLFILSLYYFCYYFTITSYICLAICCLYIILSLIQRLN